MLLHHAENIIRTEVDLINDAYLCKCPMCDKVVVPVTCAFNNCEWKMISRKAELGKCPQMLKTDWASVGNWYERFSPEKSGEASFLDLKILFQEPCEPETCFASYRLQFNQQPR